MIKAIKPGRKYILCNIDEPYAKDVYEVIKQGQMAKGPEAWPEGDISFDEWVQLTWPCSPLREAIKNAIRDAKKGDWS